MQRQFGVLSRLELLNTLRERFPGRVGQSLQQPDCSRPIVLLDSRVHAIAASQWLPTLAAARFFLCCPGGRQPLCHNLIEAMSVGTIPIIEYGDRITPPCAMERTRFASADETVWSRRSSESIAWGPRNFGRLSHRVAAFYDQHLCGTRFLRELARRQDRSLGPPSLHALPRAKFLRQRSAASGVTEGRAVGQWEWVGTRWGCSGRGEWGPGTGRWGGTGELAGKIRELGLSSHWRGNSGL